eukprot:10971106-Alexandrium_andersonii.AAC.1
MMTSPSLPREARCNACCSPLAPRIAPSALIALVKLRCPAQCSARTRAPELAKRVPGLARWL